MIVFVTLTCDNPNDGVKASISLPGTLYKNLIILLVVRLFPHSIPGLLYQNGIEHSAVEKYKRYFCVLEVPLL